MADEPEFRIGDVQAGRSARGQVKAGAPKLDDQVFPTLSKFVAAADFRQRLDELAGQARKVTDPDVRAALQTAVRLLPTLRSKYGG